jgi:hypothetical protein
MRFELIDGFHLHYVLAKELTELERSHADLRAAVIMAGKHIKKLNFGRKYDPVLARLRKVLREARLVAAQHQSTENKERI